MRKLWFLAASIGAAFAILVTLVSQHNPFFAEPEPLPPPDPPKPPSTRLTRLTLAAAGGALAGLVLGVLIVLIDAAPQRDDAQTVRYDLPGLNDDVAYAYPAPPQEPPAPGIDTPLIIEVTGPGGERFTITIAASHQAPPSQDSGELQYEVNVVRDDGKPVAGALVSAMLTVTPQGDIERLTATTGDDGAASFAYRTTGEPASIRFAVTGLQVDGQAIAVPPQPATTVLRATPED
jgi:hypothetical protein